MRDQEHLDPTERANFINEFLFQALALDHPTDFIEHPLYWDLVSYANNLLGLYCLQLAQTGISGGDELLDAMKRVSKFINSIHYSLPSGSPELGPSRDEHKALWTKRIEEFI